MVAFFPRLPLAGATAGFCGVEVAFLLAVYGFGVLLPAPWLPEFRFLR
jgi:hypothetical protein